MIKTIQSVAFYDYRKIDPQAWSEQRVVTQFGNTSGCGNRNDWCEVRAEHSPIALLHHVFETAEQAAKYCKQFGTVTELDVGGMQRFNYLMGRSA